MCNLDRFGEMYRSLEPWWAMEGAEIRARGEEVGRCGLGRVTIREGKVVRGEEGSDARRALEEMLREVGERWGARLPDGEFASCFGRARGVLMGVQWSFM